MTFSFIRFLRIGEIIILVEIIILIFKAQSVTFEARTA